MHCKGSDITDNALQTVGHNGLCTPKAYIMDSIPNINLLSALHTRFDSIEAIKPLVIHCPYAILLQSEFIHCPHAILQSIGMKSEPLAVLLSDPTSYLKPIDWWRRLFCPSDFSFGWSTSLWLPAPQTICYRISNCLLSTNSSAARFVIIHCV